MKTLFQLQDELKRQEKTAVAITQDYLSRIQDKDPSIGAFLSVHPDFAMIQANKIDLKIKNKQPLGKLAGIPIAIKDNILVEGLPMTCASMMLKNYIAPYSATVINKLLLEDAILIGKTNMDEFGMGASTENSAFHITRNPLNTDFVPGGSSGGSAAAVAAGETVLALGSDTGGSVRQPASFCGICGLKPTYGSVSRFGLTAFVSSMDTIAPLANTVEELEYLFAIMKGIDENDMTSVSFPNKQLSKDITDYKIALPIEYFTGLNNDMQSHFNQLISFLKHAGIQLTEVSLPLTPYAIPTYYVLNTAEASSNLARFDGIRYTYRDTDADEITQLFSQTRKKGFGKEVKRRILMGTYVLSAGYYNAYYRKALQTQQAFIREFNALFDNYDLILTPTTDSYPFKFGERRSNPVAMYYSDLYTCPANIAGIPALSIPFSKADNGFFVSAQLMGKAFAEEQLFQFGKFIEKDYYAHL